MLHEMHLVGSYVVQVLHPNWQRIQLPLNRLAPIVQRVHTKVPLFKYPLSQLETEGDNDEIFTQVPPLKK